MKILSKRQILILHEHIIAETGGQPGLRTKEPGIRALPLFSTQFNFFTST